MSSQNTYSELSDDDASLERRSPDEISRRRSTRACDQCRRTKSKCQRFGSDDGPCRGCMTAGISCTFAGPSHKRGPPKGYIHAIERRLHQVEALMGTIVGSTDPRAKGLLRDLSQDPLARQIIHRVDHGPFGPKGRVSHPFGSTKEDFLASIMGSANPASPSSGTRRSRRARKNSSAQDDIDLDVMSPDNTWQSRLHELLASSNGLNGDGRRHLAGGRIDSSPSSTSSLSMPGSALGTPSEESFQLALPPNFSISTPVRDVGSIDLDLSPWDGSPSTRPRPGVGMKPSPTRDDISYPQVHTYDRLNGLHIPSPRSRLVGPQALEPVLSTVHATHRLDIGAEAPMANTNLEAHLIEVYFEIFHPLFPILCKDTVLEMYNDRHTSPSSMLDRTTSTSVAYDFLLLSMFSLAVRFANSAVVSADLQESRNQYYESARKLMYTAMDNHCLFNCQALLLLAYRDIGTGSVHRAWNHVGMASRMCQSLGFHQAVTRQASENLSKDTHTQRRTFLACCVVEKHVSLLLGRTAMADGPCDYPLLPAGAGYQQEIGDRLADLCFEWTYSLSLIMGTILEQVYTIGASDASVEKRDSDASSALSHCFMHNTGLLRSYFNNLCTINASGSSQPSSDDETTTNALELSTSAAHNILTAINSWDTQYPLSNASPLLSECLLNAGKTFIMALARKSNDAQLESCLQLCRHYLQKIEPTWPNARPAHDILQGQAGDSKHDQTATIRQKRPAQESLNADTRRMRPVPTTLKQSPLLRAGTLDITNESAMAGPSYNGMDLSPREPYGPYRWENGMEYTFPGQGLVSFAAGQMEWSSAGLDAEALQLDFVNGL